MALLGARTLASGASLPDVWRVHPVASYPNELWQAVADLSGLLLSEESLETTLRRVGDLAVRCIPGCDAVGVTLLTDGAPSTRAATGGLVYEVDSYQYDIDEGPCLQAVADRQPYQVDEMATCDRWSRWCRHAAERGIHSSLSLPLIVRDEPLGALNLYSHRPSAFATGDRETALMFADQAAVAMANTQTYAASVALTEQLREALTSRSVIDQAMGAIMTQWHCDQDQAFERLRTMSQHANRKLRLVARDIVGAAQRGEVLPRPAGRSGAVADKPVRPRFSSEGGRAPLE